MRHAVDEDGDLSADLSVDAVRQLLADDHIGWRERTHVDRFARRAGQTAEGGEIGWVDADQYRVRLCQLSGVIDRRDTRFEERQDAGHVRVVRDGLLDERERSAAQRFAGTEVERRIRLLTSEDQLIDVPEVAVNVGRDRLIDRIAGA